MRDARYTMVNTIGTKRPERSVALLEDLARYGAAFGVNVWVIAEYESLSGVEGKGSHADFAVIKKGS